MIGIFKNVFRNRRDKNEEERAITLSYRSIEKMYTDEKEKETEKENELNITDSQMLAIELDFVKLFKKSLDDIFEAKNQISK